MEIPYKVEGLLEVGDVPPEHVERIREEVLQVISKTQKEIQEIVERRLRSHRRDFRKGDEVRDRYGSVGVIYYVDDPKDYDGEGEKTYEIWTLPDRDGGSERIWKSAKDKDIEGLV